MVAGAIPTMLVRFATVAPIRSSKLWIGVCIAAKLCLAVDAALGREGHAQQK